MGLAYLPISWGGLGGQWGGIYGIHGVSGAGFQSRLAAPGTHGFHSHRLDRSLDRSTKVSRETEVKASGAIL